MNFTATIPGRAIPFARPRFSGGRGYQDPAYAAWKRGAALILCRACAAQGGQLARQPLALEVTLYRPRPVKRPEGIDALTWKSGIACLAIGRSDLDNHVKAVCDALVDSGTIADDRWIVHLVAWSWYAPSKGAVGVDVTLTSPSESP